MEAVYLSKLEGGGVEETCTVGFLPKEVATKHQEFIGIIGQFDLLKNEHANMQIRQASYAKKGSAIVG